MSVITHYTVTDHRTGKVSSYKTGRAASRACDRIDSDYGAIISTRRAHWADIEGGARP